MQFLLGQKFGLLIFVFPGWGQSLACEWKVGGVKGFLFQVPTSHSDYLCVGFA